MQTLKIVKPKYASPENFHVAKRERALTSSSNSQGFLFGGSQ